MVTTVRRATRADAEAIAGFAVALFELHAEWDPMRFTQIATREGAMRFYGDRSEVENAGVLLAEQDGNPVGFAYMEYEPVLYAELATRVVWLHDIYVEPEARGKGAGRALLEKVKGEARSFGANKVLLSVAIRNVAGQKWFGEQGFTTTMHEMMMLVENDD